MSPAAAVAVIPAAGESLRMGRPKPLLPFGGGTVLGAVAAALAAGGAGEIVVVTAPGDEALARLAGDLGLRAAVNPEPSRGMLSSIQAGIAALGGGAALALRGAPLLVCPADLPGLAASTVRALLAALDGGAALAVPVYGGRRGHPLAVAPRHIAEIEALPLAGGLRRLLDLHPDELAEVAVDDRGAVEDADTPADYRRLLGRHRGGAGPS